MTPQAEIAATVTKDQVFHALEQMLGERATVK